MGPEPRSGLVSEWAPKEASGMPRGRLRVYVGVAPGVGATYAMLAEAARRRARGADVVIGVADTHGRAPLEALMVGVRAT
jgi:two-component system sensor histidine kinase KdpD